MKNNKKVLATSILALGVLMASGSAFADTTPFAGMPEQDGAGMMHQGHMRGDHKAEGVKDGVSGQEDMRPVVAGTVSAITGSSITVTDSRTNTVYTVDASSATIHKFSTSTTAPTVITVSGIAVGDMITVRGTVSGTTVTAKNIMDGKMMDGQHGDGKMEGRRGMRGTVVSSSGNTITITGADTKTYTVDATNAKIMKDKTTTLAITDVKVGDTVMVMGTVNGTTITATAIMDGIPPMMQGQDGSQNQPAPKGFFGRIGSFFKRIF